MKTKHQPSNNDNDISYTSSMEDDTTGFSGSASADSACSIL
jgi:hypothetical protein